MPYKKPKRKVSRVTNCDYPYPDDGGMHSPNLNAVCFKCRFVTRFNSRRDASPICPHCRQKMVNAFCKIEIPRKTNDRGWKLLEKKLLFS